MRDFCIHWCYSTFYMLTFSYRSYMGFISYLCAYTPNRKERKGKEIQTTGKRNRRKKKDCYNNMLLNGLYFDSKRCLYLLVPFYLLHSYLLLHGLYGLFRLYTLNRTLTYDTMMMLVISFFAYDTVQ